MFVVCGLLACGHRAAGLHVRALGVCREAWVHLAYMWMIAARSLPLHLRLWDVVVVGRRKASRKLGWSST
eukprot:5443458-Pyramimonas_sp.AAC.1